MRKSLVQDAIEKGNRERTLVEDEKKTLIMQQDLTRWERFRIFLNRWWVFALVILALSQIIQTIFLALEYVKTK